MKEGWEIKKLGEVFTFRQGIQRGVKLQSETKSAGQVRFLRIVDYTQGNEPARYIDNPGGQYLLDKKDVSLVRYGASTGFVCNGFEGALANNLFRLIPNSSFEINSEFLYYFLLSPFFQGHIQKMMNGAAMPAISFGMINNINFPLIEITQQKRIVKLIDRAFEAIDKAKANAEQNLKNAKELFESYLQNTFDNESDDWVTSTIGETCNLMTGGTPSRSKKEYFDNGTINWLVSGDINKKEIYDCEGKITELGFENSNTKILPLNSVMIALNGQGKTRGTVAMLRIKATCNQSLVSIYPKDDNEILPELIFSNLEGRYIEIRKMTGDSGNDRRGLNMPLIRKIKFSYPKSITKQKQIVTKLDTLSDETKKLEAVYQQKIDDLDELKNSILQKAFNGEFKTEKAVAI